MYRPKAGLWNLHSHQLRLKCIGIILSRPLSAPNIKWLTCVDIMHIFQRVILNNLACLSMNKYSKSGIQFKEEFEQIKELSNFKNRKAEFTDLETIHTQEQV